MLALVEEPKLHGPEQLHPLLPRQAQRRHGWLLEVSKATAMLCSRDRIFHPNLEGKMVRVTVQNNQTLGPHENSLFSAKLHHHAHDRRPSLLLGSVFNMSMVSRAIKHKVYLRPETLIFGRRRGRLRRTHRPLRTVAFQHDTPGFYERLLHGSLVWCLFPYQPLLSHSFLASLTASII